MIDPMHALVGDIVDKIEITNGFIHLYTMRGTTVSVANQAELFISKSFVQKEKIESVERNVSGFEIKVGADSYLKILYNDENFRSPEAITLYFADGSSYIYRGE